jgi:hypothetical protein
MANKKGSAKKTAAVNRDDHGHYTTPKCEHEHKDPAPSEPTSSEPAPSEPVAPALYAITCERVNIREEASLTTDLTSADIAAPTGQILNLGDVVEVTEESNGWCRLADGRGWFLRTLSKKEQ